MSGPLLSENPAEVFWDVFALKEADFEARYKESGHFGVENRPDRQSGHLGRGAADT